MMEKLIASLSVGVPAALSELITLGRALKKRAVDVLAYFDRPGTSNGPTEAIIIWSRSGTVVYVADGWGRGAWATRSLECVADVPDVAPVAGYTWGGSEPC